ncbi:unnamed protein product [Paramecium primaurelia]|uniref:Uncharacterized protein n=1 Tax=Paramecium primaurelia TaxID=5886 RepID=A0A8S1JPK6_PARPR|nr:unnamed protein product [Paramecium primaurelia]
MFDEDFDLGKQEDLAREVKEMEVKANTLQEKSQQDRYLEFSEMVVNSFKMMEKKFNEMESKFSKVLQYKNKENTTSNIRQKSVSVGKIYAPPKISAGKISLPKHLPPQLKKSILKTKK